MKLLLFGGTGMIGSRILEEALLRGHQVTSVVRDPTRLRRSSEELLVAQGDVLDQARVADLAEGHDAVLAAVGPGAEVIVGAAHSLVQALTEGTVKRLVNVGGAGSLQVAPGRLFLNSPTFPIEYREQALANLEALQIYQRNQTHDWTVVTPPVWITPGLRTGEYRVGGDRLLLDRKGESRISAEDFAVAFLDEVENHRHIRRRFTVAY